jgi:hypothetical protein
VSVKKPRTATGELPATQRQLGDAEMRIKLAIGRQLDAEKERRDGEARRLTWWVRTAATFAGLALLISAAALAIVAGLVWTVLR